jgi:biopolymer transport protein ExbD
LVEPEKHYVDIDFDGTILVDNVAVSDAELDAKLTQYAAGADDSKKPNVLLRPNKLAPYKVVAKVLASAQRHEIAKLGLIGDEQFM